MALPRMMLAMLLPMLAACDQVPVPPGARAGGAIAPAASSAMEFRGSRPCVDCAGIEAWLRLDQQGSTQRYTLMEQYRGDAGDRRFEERGDWTTQGELLRLRSADGGERVYARQADGRLQARGARGQRLPDAADDVMRPVMFDGAP